MGVLKKDKDKCRPCGMCDACDADPKVKKIFGKAGVYCFSCLTHYTKLAKEHNLVLETGLKVGEPVTKKNRKPWKVKDPKTVVVVSDTHGRTKWYDPLMKIIKNVDYVVFLGDYFDSFDIKPVDQMHSFGMVLEVKSKFPDKVQLLVGNHDVHYMSIKARNCSGYNPQKGIQYREMLMGAKKDLNMAWAYGNHLFTHAGVSEDWMYEFTRSKKGMNTIKLAELINKKWRSDSDVMFWVGPDRQGRDNTSGPLWIDMDALVHKPLKGLSQHVGHTQIFNIFEHQVSDKHKITFYDTMATEDYELPIIKIQ